MVKLKALIVKVDSSGLKKAASVVNRGGLAVFPTETCYGIAADATSPAAVEKVFSAKGRKKEKALSIIVADERMAREYCEITPLTHHLVHSFMPGPLTLVVKQKKGMLAENISNTDTVAFRIPGHSFALSLVKKIGRPITATSANPSGAPPVYVARKAKELFGDKVDLIVDAGSLPRKSPTALIDLTASPQKLLRSGALAEKAMKAIGDYLWAQKTGRTICVECAD